MRIFGGIDATSQEQVICTHTRCTTRSSLLQYMPLSLSFCRLSIVHAHIWRLSVHGSRSRPFLALECILCDIVCSQAAINFVRSPHQNAIVRRCHICTMWWNPFMSTSTSQAKERRKRVLYTCIHLSVIFLPVWFISATRSPALPVPEQRSSFLGIIRSRAISVLNMCLNCLTPHLRAAFYLTF